MADEEKNKLLRRLVNLLEEKKAHDDAHKEDMKAVTEQIKMEFGDHKPFLKAAKLLIMDPADVDTLNEEHQEVFGMVDGFHHSA